jgi:hypothetical protein
MSVHAGDAVETTSADAVVTTSTSRLAPIAQPDGTFSISARSPGVSTLVASLSLYAVTSVRARNVMSEPSACATDAAVDTASDASDASNREAGFIGRSRGTLPRTER